MGETPGAREPTRESANKFRWAAQRERLLGRSRGTAETQVGVTRWLNRTESRSNSLTKTQIVAWKDRTTHANIVWLCMAITMISTENLLRRTEPARIFFAN